MALALGTMKLTPNAMADLIAEGPARRAEYFAGWVEEQGGTLLGYCFADSSTIDIVTLCEFPDELRANVAASVATWGINWSGGLAEYLDVTWLATPEEFQAALATVHQVATPGHE